MRKFLANLTDTLTGLCWRFGLVSPGCWFMEKHLDLTRPERDQAVYDALHRALYGKDGER
jgi:hypothetical protein